MRVANDDGALLAREIILVLNFLIGGFYYVRLKRGAITKPEEGILDPASQDAKISGHLARKFSVPTFANPFAVAGDVYQIGHLTLLYKGATDSEGVTVSQGSPRPSRR